MLALITERLQNQRLEDPALPVKSCSSNIELISGQGIQFTGTKASGTSPDAHKKVWTLSYDGKKRPVNSKKKQGGQEGRAGVAGGYVSSAGPPLLSHFHNKSGGSCDSCGGNSSNTPATPPKKKHCRSLSIPADTASVSVSWQPQSSRLWKPIAVCPMVLHTKQHKNKPYSPNFGRCTDLRTSVGNNPVSCVTVTRQDTGYFTPCDFATPPESPIPRPASASSGYCEGSFSPIGAPWLDFSPYRSNKYESFKHRSLSLEDRISASITAGSVPSVLSCINSTPTSPRRHRIPRCRSQPCVLHDRRCGIKRRRDYDHRPALNFHKMAETAYPYKGGASLTPLATPYEDYQAVNPFRPSSFREELQSAISLVPIASSPLDTEIPIKAIESPKASPIKEASQFCQIAMSEDSGCSEVDEGEPPSDICPCQEDDEQGADNPDMFHIADLDLEEIESH